MSTYTPVASQTLSSSASSVTFSSIPQDYTDLVLVIQTSINSGANDTWLQFNSDGGNNYSRTKVAGNGTSATSFRGSNADAYYGVGNIGTGWMTSTNHIMNYSNSTTYKTVLIRDAGTVGNGVTAEVGLWRNTAAITSITVGVAATYTMSAGTTITLYGIKAA